MLVQHLSRLQGREKGTGHCLSFPPCAPRTHLVSLFVLLCTQGREKDIAFFSTVRSQRGTRGIGFVADERRINVGLTRARCVQRVLAHGGEWRMHVWLMRAQWLGGWMGGCLLPSVPGLVPLAGCSQGVRASPRVAASAATG